MLKEVLKEIEQRDRFLLTSHARPDGDAIGSALACCQVLRAMGKDAEVVLRKRLPTGIYRDVFTGKAVSPVLRDGDFVLPISEAFAHLPIAALVNVGAENTTEAPADAE